MNFKEKRNLKKVLYSKFTIVMLSFAVVFLSNAVWGVYKKAQVAHTGKVKVQNKLRSLKHRETALVAGIKKLNSSRGIESEIRDRFGVIKEGEELVVIVDQNIEDVNHNIIYEKSNNIFKKLMTFFD